MYDPTTNRLRRMPLEDLNGADLFRLFSQKYGGDTAVTLAVLADYMQAAFPTPGVLARQSAAPTTSGFSVTVNADSTWLLLFPSATLAAGTIVLPAGPVDRSEFDFYTSNEVTAITVDGNGATVTGAPSTVTAGATFRLRYDAQTLTWYPV